MKSKPNHQTRYVKSSFVVRYVLATMVLWIVTVSPYSPAAQPAAPHKVARYQAVVEALLRLDEPIRFSDNLDLQQAVRRYLQRTSDTEKYLDVVAKLQVRGQDERLIGIITADPASSHAVAAAQLLLTGGNGPWLAEQLSGQDESKERALVTTLGHVASAAAVELLGPLITNTDRPRWLRNSAASALGHSNLGQELLLKLAREDRLPDDVRFTAANAVFGASSAEVRKQAAAYFERPMSGASEPLPPLAELIVRHGDPQAGKKIFETTGQCAKCHKVFSQGGEVGPDLSEIGSKLSREALYVSILDPNAGISHGYHAYSVLTVDGLVVVGILVSQTNDEVILRTAENVQQTIRREDIDEIQQQSQSLMPSDVHKSMSVQNLVDLVEYLASLRKEREAPPHQSPDEIETAETSRHVSRHPEAAVKHLSVAKGLRASLFAAEPLITNPASIDVDARGRVWVCDVVNYRHFANPDNPVRTGGDRILVLEDTDRDGRADESTTFYQGRDIDSPHGVCVLGNRVIVSAGESVWVFIDDDGDLRADQKRLLFTGIGGAQNDHGIHAVVFGPDGRLYFNFGNAGVRLQTHDKKTVVDLAGNKVCNARQPYQQGMVLRCNLDGSEVETLAWNFRNNWELCVDSFGTIWQSDNDDDGNRATRINFVMEFGNYGYCDERTGAGWRNRRLGMHRQIPQRHWHQNDPGVVPNVLITGAGAPCGILIYEGALFGQRFGQQLIHCEPGMGVVRTYPLQVAGAGYRGRMVNVVEGVRDTWFRPVDVCTSPDGSLFIADWYDPGVGGHRMDDLERGRLFRVVPEGGDPGAIPDFHFDNAAGAINGLRNANTSVRHAAWVALHQMGPKAESELLELFAPAEPPYLRARALWLLGRIPGRAEHYVQQAIHDADPDIRIVGLRLARQMKLDLVPLIEQVVDDPSPPVRRESAIALRHLKAPEKPRLWAELAMHHDGKDRWYLEALGIGADTQWRECFEAWRQAIGENWNTPAGRDIVWRSRAPAACRYLAEIIVDPATTAKQQESYFRALDFHAGRHKRQALESIVASSLQAAAAQQ